MQWLQRCDSVACKGGMANGQTEGQQAHPWNALSGDGGERMWDRTERTKSQARAQEKMWEARGA